MSGVKCSVCGKEAEFGIRTWKDKSGKWMCEHDVAASAASDPLEAQRIENRNASQAARQMANQAAAEEEERDPTKTVNMPDGPRDQFSGAAKIKKSTLDTLIGKAEEALDLTPPPEE